MLVNVFTTREESTNEGHFYFNYPGDSIPTEIAIPSGVFGTARPPSHVEYGSKRIIAGQFSKVLVFLPSPMTLVTAGIAAPASAPVIAIGASGVPIGIILGYVSFRHKDGSTIIHESNLSPVSNSITVSSQKVEWSSLPTTSPDSRVTHIVLYRSDDGADPREVVELTLGTSTYSDNIATAALGAVGPTNNGVPPASRFATKYHDRIWYTSLDNPSRIYYSELSEPESVGTSSFISTRDGETITGAERVLDQLAVFGRRCTYDIQGYTSDDFNMRKVHPSVGCISGAAVVNIDERLFFPAEDGIWIYDGGSFTYTMEDLRSYWKDDYVANIGYYNSVSASADRSFHVYRLLLKRSSSPFTFYFIGHYRGIDGGKPIRWTFDVRAREDNAIGEIDTGSGLLQSYTGSCDGHLRAENVDSDADDDDDSYAKALNLTTRTDFLGDIGGGTLLGKTFTDYTAYLKAESNAWTLALYAGEEDLTSALSATLSIPSSASASSALGQTFLPKNQWPFKNLIGVSGIGAASKITASSPLGMRFRGYDWAWKEGPGTRARQT